MRDMADNRWATYVEAIKEPDFGIWEGINMNAGAVKDKNGKPFSLMTGGTWNFKLSERAITHQKMVHGGLRRRWQQEYQR